MPDIPCPRCNLVTPLVAIRKHSDEFCERCDYPLFWAPSAEQLTKPGSVNQETLRRLPGAEGRERAGSKECPECGELNATTASLCSRCDADLDPRPAPPPAREPAPIVLEVPVAPPPAPKLPWWPWPVIALVVLIHIVVVVVAIT